MFWERACLGKTKERFFSNQQIVANSISKNKLPNQLEKKMRMYPIRKIDVTKDFF